ncbi:M23 family metallopeptidase [Paenibacillus sp. 481]|uniref:M23 family metallopeptidase n=1 Tax=Paenibacillus sp. 481 TaxID=2835869 RepID=UPI001E648FB2|nr:M23 family metallopeptidase [Paenibacillus sp. 481]UHA74211.1 M23 family metallopeptidase [Paenibacillus sp. 481]
MKGIPFSINRTRTRWFYRLYALIGISQLLIFIFFIPSLLVSSDTHRKAISISFPFKHGLYFVGQGGSNESMNYHFKYPTQKYAVDIVKLNPFGLRNKPFGDKMKLDNYAVYGETIYSPVEGKIVATVDGINDEIRIRSTTGKSNMIVIEYEHVYILLLHLKKGSLQVKEGDIVTIGQPLAQVGNSGYSTEPHLHIHAIQREPLSNYLNGASVPIKFNGVFLKRNDIIYNQRILFR